MNAPPQRGGSPADPSGSPGGGPAGDPGGSPGGGGVADVLVALDKQLSQVVQAVTQSQAVPDDAKQDFSSALDSWRSGLQKLMSAAGGEGGSQPDSGGAVSPEQGGSQGAVPMSPAGVRK